MRDDQNQVYYCSQCGIETTLSRVCPKCHRKTTLQPRGQSEQVGGPRRRASSTQLRAVGGTRRWLWLGGGLAALLVVGGAAWWFLGSRGSGHAPKKKTARKATGAHRFGTPPTKGGSRVFGARPKGVRVAPPPPARICGTGYRIRIAYRFAAPAATGRKGAKGPKARPTPRRKPGRPEAIEHRHDFLIAGRSGRLSYVPLEFEIRATMNGRTGTGLKLDRTGGLLPDPRTRKLRRVGPHDSLEPGLRISDLIGHAQARVAHDPAGGLKIAGIKLRNRLVAGWVQTGVGLATFLLPRPPKPGARSFTDTRLPPKGMFAGVTALLRRFRRQRPAQGGQTTIVYQVDSPRGAMRKAKTTVRAAGEVKVVPGEVLPRSAKLTLQGLPAKKGSATAATIQFERTGRRCNDK